jgi:signal transduction histidine kinase
LRWVIRPFIPVHGNDLTVTVNISLAVVSLVTVLISLTSAQTRMPATAIMWTATILHYLGMMLLPFTPRLAGWLILIVASLSLIAQGDAPSQIEGVYVAQVVLAYYSQLPTAIVTAAVCAADLWLLPRPEISLSLASVPKTILSVMIAIAISALLTIIGRTLAKVTQAMNRHEARENAAREQLNQLERDNDLAIEIHDTLSNDLTYISTIAREHAGSGRTGSTEATSDSDNADWQHVLARSQMAFTRVHRIIDYLSGHGGKGTAGRAPIATSAASATDRATPTSTTPTPPSTTTPATATTTFTAQLHQRVHEMRDDLESSGFHGQITITGISTDDDDAAQEEVLSLITEIGTNIRRHAAKDGDGYLICISLNADGIIIREINTTAVHDALPTAEQSGRGLAMHKQRIATLGGELNCNEDDGTWLIYARIPWALDAQ